VAPNDLSELIRYLAASMVDDPDAVHIDTKRGNELTYLIQVATGEEGRVIGRQGRIIQAIRTVARAAGDHKERIQVDVAAPKR
jgi:uncharacterized protein